MGAPRRVARGIPITRANNTQSAGVPHPTQCHTWADWLQEEETDFVLTVRRNTTNGWPTGSDAFVAHLEAQLDRRLTRLPASRKRAMEKNK